MLGRAACSAAPLCIPASILVTLIWTVSASSSLPYVAAPVPPQPFVQPAAASRQANVWLYVDAATSNATWAQWYSDIANHQTALTTVSATTLLLDKHGALCEHPHGKFAADMASYWYARLRALGLHVKPHLMGNPGGMHRLMDSPWALQAFGSSLRQLADREGYAGYYMASDYPTAITNWTQAFLRVMDAIAHALHSAARPAPRAAPSLAQGARSPAASSGGPHMAPRFTWAFVIGSLFGEGGGRCAAPEYWGATCAQYRQSGLDVVFTENTYNNATQADVWQRHVAAVAQGLGPKAAVGVSAQGAGCLLTKGGACGNALRANGIVEVDVWCLTAQQPALPGGLWEALADFLNGSGRPTTCGARPLSVKRS